MNIGGSKLCGILTHLRGNLKNYEAASQIDGAAQKFHSQILEAASLVHEADHKSMSSLIINCLVKTFFE